MELAVYIVQMAGIGIGVGLISNTLGLGGGILMVPAFLEFVDGMDTNTAKGTSLLTITLVASVNAWRLNSGGEFNVPWRLAGLLAMGSIVGGFVGGWVTGILPDYIVAWVFITFMALVGVRTFFIEPPKVTEDQVRSLRFIPIVIGFCAGFAGGATGTGGGAVLVPLTLIAGLTTNERVVALSNLVMIGTAAASTAAHLIAPQTADLPQTIGQVYLPIVPFVFMGALIVAPFGRILNKRMSLVWRKGILGGLLIIIVVRLIYRVAFAGD